MSAPALATRVIGELLTRTALDGAQVDDVIFGQGYPSSAAPLIARVAALGVGLPITAGGYQVDRRRGSGLQAVIDAAMQIHVGAGELVVAGGVECTSSYSGGSSRHRRRRSHAARLAHPRAGDRRRKVLPDAGRNGRDRGEPAA